MYIFRTYRPIHSIQQSNLRSHTRIISYLRVILNPRLLFRLNDTLDNFEGYEEVTDIVGHPPGSEKVSDTESVDEENPALEHLPRTLLQTEAEESNRNVEEEEEAYVTTPPAATNNVATTITH